MKFQTNVCVDRRGELKYDQPLSGSDLLALCDTINNRKGRFLLGY